MAQLIVRNIEEEIVQRLRVRAARSGRSAEEEHRRILREALAPESERLSIKELLSGMPDRVTARDFRRSRARSRKVTL